ncbi:MAG: lipopolysaccharide biosynthesis protein [Thermodesulfobacteriota bacterium]
MIFEGTSEARKFTTDTIWVGVSQLILRMRGLITAPFLIGTYGSEGYGVLAQIAATTGLLSHILGLRLPAACVRFMSTRDDEPQRRQRAFGGMMTTMVLLNMLALAASLYEGEFLSEAIFGPRQYFVLVWLTFLWILSINLLDLLTSYLRSDGRIKTLTVIQLLVATVAVVLIVLFSSLKLTLQSLVTSLIASEFFFCAVVLGIIVRDHGFPRPGFFDIRRYLLFSLPLIPLGLVRWVVDSSDRFFVTHFLNLSQTGIYSLSYAVGGVISMFSFPIFFVLFPTISREWDLGNHEKVRNYFSYSTSAFLLFAVPVSLLLYFESKPLLDMLVHSDATIRADLIFLIAASTVMAGVFQINVYIVYLTKKARLMLLVFILGAGINVLLNIILIPSIGITGAAVATFIAYLVLCIIMACWGRSLLQYTIIDLRFLLKLVTATIVTAIWLTFYVQHGLNGILGILFSTTSAVMIFAAVVFKLKIFSREEIHFFRETLFKT